MNEDNRYAQAHEDGLQGVEDGAMRHPGLPRFPTVGETVAPDVRGRKGGRQDAADPGGILESFAGHPEYLGAMASVVDLLSEVKSTHGLALLIGLRHAFAEGRRPLTCGEARTFLSRSRQMSDAGSKKTMRRLVEQGLAIPVPNPCIDKVVDLHAGPRLVRAIPVLGKPYTLYRVSRDGDLARKKFDTAWLSFRRVAPENRRMAEWIALWEQLRPAPDKVPTSLTPFFASPLAKRPSPMISGIVSVASESPHDYEILAFDGPPRQDPAFMKGIRGVRLKDFRYSSWRAAMRADFQLGKALAEPLFYHLKGTIDSSPHDYYRLILPVSTNGETVDLLIIVVELASDRVCVPGGS